MDVQRLYSAFLECGRVTTDSRAISGGEMFFGLKGENFDGNEYAFKALEAGARYAVVDEGSTAAASGDARLIVVPDTLEALQALARHHRENTFVDGKRLTVIGLTGTNGKTTTKELITRVLSVKYNVTSTQGNLNNDIGVPLSVLNINSETQLAVIEMGANHPDDIEKLVKVCEPDYGLITNVGKAHLLGFGSFEGVKKAKGKLYDYISEHGGSIFLNADDENLAAMAAGITRGDEVIVPTLTFIAAVNPLTRYVGAEPIFIGCDDSLCIDPDAVEDFCANHCELRDGKLYNKTTDAHVKALEVVHVFGNMADMPRLMAIAKRYGLIVIEDATEALGTRCTDGPFAGKFAGTIGDIGCYSFNGNKIITTGAGGAVVSNHPDWAEHAKHLSTQAKADMLQFLHDEVGYNYRMTNVQASLGLAQLERLEGFIAHKKALYDRYAAALDGVKGLRILPFREEECRSNHWFFSLYLKDSGLDRDTVIEKLQAQHIQTRPVWALIHEQADYPRNEAYGLDKALDYRKYIVNLPCSTNLSFEDCDRVIEAVLGL